MFFGFCTPPYQRVGAPCQGYGGGGEELRGGQQRHVQAPGAPQCTTPSPGPALLLQGAARGGAAAPAGRPGHEPRRPGGPVLPRTGQARLARPS